MKGIPFYATISTTILSVVLAAPLSATQFRGGESVVVAKGDSIADDFFLSCGSAKISGTVTGDLFFMGGSLVAEGPIKGSVMAAGRSIDLSGSVSGSGRLAGQNLVVSTHIARNLMAAGQTIHLGSETRIEGDAHLAGEEILIDGQVLGNLYVSGPGGLWILSPAGRHLGTIQPPELPANFAFGGEDGRTLYMTARTGLYRMRLLVPGIRPQPAKTNLTATAKR